MDWRRTPGYIIREEVKRSKLRTKAAKRAWSFEEKLREGKGGELARVCWKEVTRRAEGGGRVSRWEEGRNKYFEERGWERSMVERERGRRKSGMEGSGKKR